MIFGTILRYPTKLDINKIRISHLGIADRYVDFLRKEIKCDIDMECKIAVYGMMFRRIEISLKEGDWSRDYAEYSISSIVQYEPLTLNWTRSHVMTRMVEGVALLQFEHVFAQMLKYNPLIILGRRVMLALFTYGTGKMMEMVLDLCELNFINFDEDDNIPEGSVDLEICNGNPMCSEGSRLFMNRLKETIAKYEEEYDIDGVVLKMKKEIIDTYKIDESDIDEKIVESEKYNTDSKKDKQCIIF